MASSNTVFHKDFDSCVSADRRPLCGGSYRCIQKEDTFGIDGGAGSQRICCGVRD